MKLNIAENCTIFSIVLMIISVPGLICAEEVEDADITSHIETEMWVDDAVPSNTIDVSTEEGIVTLSGTVNNILARDRAERIAEATVGVRSVVNKINVQPPVTWTDADVKDAVEMALINDPATEAYEVRLKADDGTVTLEGMVESWQEKQLAASVAKGVRGVRDIKNNITVNYKSQRGDFEIKKEIESRLENDVRIDDNMIDVDVEDGEVKLDGTVGSLKEKNQAETDCWVAGVKGLDTDQLQIKWWARDDMQRKDLYAYREDSEIKQAVKDSFRYDPRVEPGQVRIDVDTGEVSLSGVIDNLAEKRSAENDARNTIGVTRVVNNLKVRPALIPGNDELENKVSRRLLSDPYTNRFDLEISAYGGTVYLSGKVHTSWEKRHAGEIAGQIEGVSRVVNNISSERQWSWKPDWQLKDNIERQYFWSPFVDGDQVNVTVENGIATLTGTVDTYSERQSAEDNAFEGGAKDVVNNLMVSYRTYGPAEYGPYSPYYGF